MRHAMRNSGAPNGLEAGKIEDLQLYGDFLDTNTTRKKCKDCVPRDSGCPSVSYIFAHHAHLVEI